MATARRSHEANSLARPATRRRHLEEILRSVYVETMVSWIAVSVYLLVAIVRKRLGLDVSHYQILQSLPSTTAKQTLYNRRLECTLCWIRTN